MTASARFAREWARDLVDVAGDWSTVAAGGRWMVTLAYDGDLVAARFANWTARSLARPGRWQGPGVDAWSTSLDKDAYCSAVESVRDAIARGDVYQVNVCRVLRAPLSPGLSMAGLDAVLAARNPAPYGGYLELPERGVSVACASPELFLSIRWVNGRRVIRSGPIKGTGRTAADLQDKDAAENVMIVDLVRNDLSRICRTGTVEVPRLLAVEEHPGLVHLVSYVEGELEPDCTWGDIAHATFPPGSVTGAPKSAALRIIEQLEPAGRGRYCGAFGWIDADTGECELAVSIRTFWTEADDLCFGTGAGITWASDAQAEWDETVLKADRLIGAASSTWEGEA